MLIGIFVIIALTAWGIRGLIPGIPGVPTGKRWLILFLGKRLPWSVGEGICWLPHGLFSYLEFDILEEEFPVIADDLPDPKRFETIVTNNGVEVVIRNVTVFYHIAYEDTDTTASKWHWLRFLGWQYSQTLYDFSKVKNEDLKNRLPLFTQQALRLVIPTFSYQELLGISLEGTDVAPPNREASVQTRASAETLITDYCRERALRIGVVITSINIGDIDPNVAMQKAREEKAIALVRMQAALVQTTQIVEQAKILLTAGGVTTPSYEQIMHTVSRLFVLDNQKIAAEKTGDIGHILQKFAGIVPTAVLEESKVA